MIKTTKTVTPFSHVYDLVLIWLIVLSIQFTTVLGGTRISLSLAVASFGISISFDLYSSPFHK